MKKIILMTLCFLCFFMLDNKYINNNIINAENSISIHIENFEINDKKFNNKSNDNFSIKFCDDENNEIKLNCEDYFIYYRNINSGFDNQKDVMHVGSYVCLSVELTTDKYNLTNNNLVDNFETSFNITKADEFTVKINDVENIENTYLNKLKLCYDIDGICYTNLNVKYYIMVDNTKKYIDDIATNQLTLGEYILGLEIIDSDNNLKRDYQNIKIENAKYYVNKLSLQASENVSIKMSNGIRNNYTSNFEKTNSGGMYFNDDFIVDYEFKISLNNQGEKKLINGTVEVNYEILNNKNFEVYVLKNNNAEKIIYGINNNKITLKLNGDIQQIFFVYKRTNVYFYIFTIIFLIVGILEIIISIKVFGFRLKIMSFSLVEILLLKYSKIDYIFFMISIWFVFFSSILLYYSINNKKKMDKIKQESYTSDDEELFNIIAKIKSNDYQLEEITDDENN